MSIPQAALGAVVAGALVFAPGAGQHAGSDTGLRQTTNAYLTDARLCRDVVVDIVFDAAGELASHFKRI